MRKTTLRYWMCQVLGWGIWPAFTLFFVFFYANDMYLKPIEKRNIFFAVLAIEFLWNILATHTLRYVLKKLNWITFPSNRVIALFLLSVTLTGLVSFYGAKSTAVLTGYSLVEYDKREAFKAAVSKEKALNLSGTDYYRNTQKESDGYTAAQNIKKSTGWYRNSAGNWQYEDQDKGRFWWDIILTFLFVSLWLLLYMVWHYLVRNRKDEIDKISLEKTVKELELNTIKSHINPHFIFNSLNSIRALVDENPQRARTAITELSNILRSSMQVEKMETVPLHKELDIVKDYLALEHMRFEERLKIEMDIDEDTLEQPVPPMMLQTLVENAIKHGISKKIKGGVVRVTSKFTDHHFELIVQNTGTLSDEFVPEGFGLKSTRDRLKFLFQGKADFQITKINGSEVQARIVMPVSF
ncbi:sensor histidine kinase [Ginsengibacter hankyongi]|nr:histidine kinase [Ginsengibacter hankyongi]